MESVCTHRFEQNEGLVLIGIHTFRQQSFLLYLIDAAPDASDIRYLLTEVTTDDIERFKQGAQAFLHAKLAENALYEYTCKRVITNNEISFVNTCQRLTNQEAQTYLPIIEFTVD